MLTLTSNVLPRFDAVKSFCDPPHSPGSTMRGAGVTGGNRKWDGKGRGGPARPERLRSVERSPRRVSRMVSYKSFRRPDRAPCTGRVTPSPALPDGATRVDIYTRNRAGAGDPRMRTLRGTWGEAASVPCGHPRPGNPLARTRQLTSQACRREYFVRTNTPAVWLHRPLWRVRPWRFDRLA